MKNVRCALAAVWLTLSPLLAQGQPSHDPTPTQVTIRTVLRDGGVPMPGVPVYLVPRGALRQRAKADGWLRAVDASVERLEAAEVVRSDPDGFATLTVPDGQVTDHELFVGSCYRSQRLEKNEGQWVLRVERLEPFAVLAVDEAGRPMPHLVVALHDRGHDLAVERTDAHGVAVFGIDAAWPEQLIVAPAGWVGPLDPFPKWTRRQGGKSAKLVVPPFGTVRIRALREGKPAPTTVFSAKLTDLPQKSIDRGSCVADCPGVEFGPVPIGYALRGRFRAGYADTEFELPVPRIAGEVFVLDIETDPVRAKLAFEVVAPGFAPQEGSYGLVRVRAQTDVDWFEESRMVRADGRVLATFGYQPLRGERLLRVDLELSEFGKGPTWLANIEFDRPLTTTVLELGTIAMTLRIPTLRGRVVDWQGEPVANANIDIAAEPGSGSEQQQRVWADQDGIFEWVGEPFRGPDGKPVRMVATPSTGQGVRASYGDACAPAAAGSEVTLALRRPTRGYLEVTLRTPRRIPSYLLQFAFVAQSGARLSLDMESCQWTGSHGDACRLGPLPAGTGSLLVRLRPGCELLRIDDVEVVAGEARSDARLHNLDFTDLVTTLEMRVVDKDGAPLPNARIRYASASDECSINANENGVLSITKAREDDRRITITADGKEPLVLTEVREGGVICMMPKRHVQVSVVGLPEDLPRARIGVMFRSVIRQNVMAWQVVSLDGEDAAMVPVPPRGGYHVWLVVIPETGGWSMAAQRATDVMIEEGELEPITYTVDAQAVLRLRELLAK